MSEFPLQEACINNQLSKVQELVENAENKRKLLILKDNDGRTALHWAISFQFKPIMKYLLSKMKQIDLDNLADDSGWTPFHIACAVGDLEIVKELYDRDIKPDLDYKTAQGTTALHLAVAKKYYYIVEYLINEGANIKAKDKLGQIPLHRAAAQGQMKLVSLLCSKGSPINLQDNDGWSPLFYALSEGHGDIATFLVNEYKADTTLVDKKGFAAEQNALNDQVRSFFLSNI